MYTYQLNDFHCSLLSFKSIQLIDSDNWPWLAHSSDPCGAEGDIFVLLLLPDAKCINTTFSILLNGESVGWLAGWQFVCLAGGIWRSLTFARHEIVVVNRKSP